MIRLLSSIGLLALLLVAGCGDAETVVTETVTAEASSADFTGSGTKNIGPVDLLEGADAEWTSTGALFFLIALKGPPDMANPQLIVSQAAGGTGYIPPGRYSFKVSTDSGADWTLTFRER